VAVGVSVASSVAVGEGGSVGVVVGDSVGVSVGRGVVVGVGGGGGSWQLGKKVLVTIFAVCPLVALLPQRK
jgi:hypothetical protein